MGSFAVYEKATGRIIRVGHAPDSMVELQAQDGEGVIGEHADLLTDYVLDGKITPRPQSPATLDGAFLRNVPVPCQITINGKLYLCNDTVAELDFTYLGTYHIKAESFPYVDKEFTVTKK